MAHVKQRGSSWRVFVRMSDVRKTRTFDTEAEAWQWADAEEARIKSRAKQQATDISRSVASLTVADLFGRYASEVSPEKGGDRWEVIRLRALRTAFLMRVAECDSEAICRWRDARLKQVSGSTVARELNLISAVFTRALAEWSLKKEGVPVNPVHGISWPKQNKSRDRRVSNEEVAAILKALSWDGKSQPQDIDQWVGWGFLLALETAMRKGEVLRLTWDNIFIAERRAHLTTTKNGDPRDVPLSKRALALFAMLTPGVTGQRVVPVTAGTFGAYFTRAVRDAEIADLHFHDARREATSRLAPKFASVMDLAKTTGHKTLTILMNTYYKPKASHLADLMDAD